MLLSHTLFHFALLLVHTPSLALTLSRSLALDPSHSFLALSLTLSLSRTPTGTQKFTFLTYCWRTGPDKLKKKREGSIPLLTHLKHSLNSLWSA